MVTQQDILDQLTALKQKDRAYLKPADYKKFMPNGLPNIPARADSSIFTAQAKAIMDTDNQRTLLSSTKAQNTRDFNEMLRAQRQIKAAKERLAAAQKYQVQNVVKNVPGGHNLGTITTRQGSSAATKAMAGGRPVASGPARNIAVGNVKRFKDAHGHSMLLNPSVGKRFVGFLNALQGTGYRVTSLGSYANRNIAGSSTKSLHAYGLAIDINPAQNPVTYGHIVTNLPKGVGQLAAKYGLVWGGNWNGSKRDTMHFSVPAFGTK